MFNMYEKCGFFTLGSLEKNVKGMVNFLSMSGVETISSGEPEAWPE